MREPPVFRLAPAARRRTPWCVSGWTADGYPIAYRFRHEATAHHHAARIEAAGGRATYYDARDL